jgi:transcriptional regulator GlxA family with amidase domain
MKFTILLLENAFASSVAISLDMLATAVLMANRLGIEKPTWQLVSPHGGIVSLSNGLSIPTVKLPSRKRSPTNPDESIWIIPGLGVTSAHAIEERMTQLDSLQAAAAIKEHYRRGGLVAASCSAVFLLALANILHGKSVTTTWWLASQLRLAYREIKVDSQQLLIEDGNVVTAGASSAHGDLMLYLLAKHIGPKLAQAVANVLLIDTRTKQSLYAIPSVLAGVDPLISKISKYVETSLPNIPPLKEIAQAHFLTERTMARRVVAATGLPPSSLIQQVRLAKAKHLLESTRLAVEQIAEQVGYADATALRRMLKKVTDSTPRQMRSKTVSSKP